MHLAPKPFVRSVVKVLELKNALAVGPRPLGSQGPMRFVQTIVVIVLTEP